MSQEDQKIEFLDPSFSVVVQTIDFPVHVLPGGKMPFKAYAHDACFDCFARLPSGPVAVEPGGVTMIPLGFRIALGNGWEAQVRPRSGLARAGVQVTLGTVDGGYREEVGTVVVNGSPNTLFFRDGDKVSQMAIRRVPCVNLVSVEGSKLPASCDERGGNGWGSTGLT